MGGGYAKNERFDHAMPPAEQLVRRVLKRDGVDAASHWCSTGVF